MDNLSFDITASGDLKPWLACCMGESRKAVGWSSHNDGKGEWLVLYWVVPTPAVDGYHPLPSPALYDQVADHRKGMAGCHRLRVWAA